MNPPEPNYVRSKIALARRLEISRVTLDRYLSLPGAPEHVKGKGYDLAGVTDFIGEHALSETTRTKASEQLKSLKAKELSLKCDRLKFRLDVERGEYVLKRDVADSLSGSLIPIREALRQKFEHDLPLTMSGMGVPEARIVGRRLYDDLLERIRAVFLNWKI